MSLLCDDGVPPMMCVCTSSLRFFKKCHSAELNKFVQALMRVNPYNNHTASLLRPLGKGYFDIVLAP